MADRTFSIVREISRKELNRHQKRFIGITVRAPAFKDINGDGILEWSTDVRVGVKEGWGVVKDVLIAQGVTGVITDMGVPVLCERSEAGLVTIIARSEIRLPDIVYTTYSYKTMGLEFMENLRQVNGQWRDGFGHPMPAPAEAIVSMEYKLLINSPSLDDPDFEFGETDLSQGTYDWESTPRS